MPTPAANAAAPARTRLRIGAWSVDAETNELRRDGETVRIEPKAMDVLMLLADSGERVLSREEIFAAVWPGVIVGDEALTQTIIKLRRALGDNSRSPTYIETISKRGYRLIAPVGPAAGVEAAAPGPAPSMQAPRAAASSGRARRTAWAAAAVLAVAIGGYYVQAILTASTLPEAIDADNARAPAWTTVTVLPFDSLGLDRDQTYFARGISDDLATDLSRLSGLRLIRSSGSAPNAAGREARYRISGSVARDALALRINIYLTDTTTNEQLWSGRFERPYGDLFAVQNEIVAKLTSLLPTKMGEAERRRLAQRYTRSLDAYDWFLRAQALFLVRGDRENDEARTLYRKALEYDPGFARAYAGLAMTYAMSYRLRDSGDASRSLARAYELAQTARSIDPDIPEVYWALGFVHAQSRRHQQAIEALQHAIRLDPSFADAYALLGGIHTYVGHPAESITLLRTAMRLNPDGGHLYFLLLGRAYLFENDYEQALINLREALMRNPADIETHVYLAAALAASGDRSAAQWEANEIHSLDPRFATVRWLDSYPMTDARQKERLVSLLGTVGL